MRYRIVSLLSMALVLLGACSAPNDGDEAKAHAQKLGFTVTGVNDTSAVVKIGEHCRGKFTSWSAGNGDQINSVYLNGKDVWNLNNTKAEGPDQFKNFPQTAECYDK